MNIEHYVNELYENQNKNADETQKNLYSKEGFYEIIRPVFEVIKENKDLTIEEYRSKLFEKVNLEKIIKNFVYAKDMSSGIALTYGTNNYQETILIGNSNEISMDDSGKFFEDKRTIEENSIFDIASITKLFTSVSVLILANQGEIDLNDEVIKYDPRFKNLKGVTIHDLLSFNIPLMTNGRIDVAGSKDEAEQLLFDIAINYNNDNTRPYTDMNAMILKYVIENVSGKKYYDFLKDEVLEKLGMNDTFSLVPDEKTSNIVSTNYSVKFNQEGEASRVISPVGMVHDPKAQIMRGNDGDLSGHSGIMMSVKDMEKFIRSLNKNELFDSKLYDEMVKNRTGRYVENGNRYVQSYGYQVYKKHPVVIESELHHTLSGDAFASAGWTGTTITSDQTNGINLAMFGNKAHNRVPLIGATVKNVRIDENENGKKSILLLDGNRISLSNRFAWDKGKTINATLDLVLQYKVLEDILSYQRDTVAEKTIRM